MRLIPASYRDGVYTKVERSFGGLLGPDLTWGTARGAIIWLGQRCLYVRLFFWRGA